MKFLQKIEMGLAAIAAVGLILRVFGFGGGELMVTLGLAFLGFLYFIAHLFFYPKDNRKTLFAILSGLAFGYGTFCVMCKVQLVPNQPNTQLLTSMAFLAMVLVLALVRTKVANEHLTFYRAVLRRAGILGSTALIMYLMPPKTLVHLYYGHDQELETLEMKVFENPTIENEKMLHEYEQNKK